MSPMHHSHHHRPAERSNADRRSLSGALAIILAIMAAEVVAGLVGHSLALLADAGHMLTDALALALALLAGVVATRPAGGQWTFGLGRAEVLAAQANGLSLLGIGIGILAAAIDRLVHPPHVQGVLVVTVALVGLAGNLAATALLARGRTSSINVRAAFLHVSTDMAAFAGTALAGALVLATGWNRFDPLAGLLISALCFFSAWSLIRESMRIVLEGSPGDIDPDEVGRALASEADVVEVHDLHVWTVTSGFAALSAHVLVTPGADCHATRRRLAGLLGQRFGLEHTTLQVEHASSATPLELGDPVRRERPLEPR
ncbi:MAG: cation diffusion facilitator family transporter [Gaiellaceae bacterium]